ncbi:MAG: HAMP domain-containing histidine kinase [Spirochaetes bacterium]|nr:HAMP domain-containing histidine kinase [Spirochaetota bacterium]
MEQIIIMISCISLGILLTSSIMLTIFGSKSAGSFFISLIWLGCFLNVLFELLYYIYQSPILLKLCIFHYFLPVFYFLSLSFDTNHSKKKFFIFIIPVFFIISQNITFLNLPAFLYKYYHHIIWTILIFYTTGTIKKTKFVKNIRFGLLLSYTSLIIISLFAIIVLTPLMSEKLSNLEKYLLTSPIFFALASLLSIIFMYFNDALLLDSQYHNRIQYLKAANNLEKRSITEKISASIIHEIKNPVAAVKSLTQQMDTRWKQMDETRIHKYFQIILEELDKIHFMSLTFLKGIKKNDHIKAEHFLLSEQISQIMDLIEIECRNKKVKIINNIPQQIKVFFKPYQFRQILLNIIYNAMEAQASKIILAAEIQNDFAVISIENNGLPIDEKLKEKIFTPFFTTKESGTGIGLTICRELLHEQKGNLKYQISPEGQSRFIITLPTNNRIL